MAFGSRTVRGSSSSSSRTSNRKKDENENKKKKKKKHGNKRKCTRGINCPFQNEHQHNLEFYHEGDDGIANKEEGENKSTSACSSFEAFSGNGNVARTTSTTTSTSSSSSLDGRNVKESRRIAAEEAASRRIKDTHSSSTTTRTRHPDIISIDCGDDHEEEEKIDTGQKLEGDSNEPIDLVSPVSTRPSSHASSHVVDLCDDDDEPAKPSFGGRKRRAKQSERSSGPMHNHQRQRMSNGYSEHEQVPPIVSHPHDVEEEEQRQISRALAISNHDVIKEQDAEYYESLRADQEKDQIKKDKQTMEQIMEESIKSQQLEEQVRMEHKKRDSLHQLDAEPGSCDGVVTIAFKLPRALGRITRRFAPNAKSDQMHFFLIQCEELADVGEWRLCNVVGGKEIVLGGDQKTLEELGLAPRGLVIVREVDC